MKQNLWLWNLKAITCCQRSLELQNL